MKLNLDYLVDCLWAHLDLIRVFTKKPGNRPDFSDAIILRNGVTVKHVCHAIHRSLPEVFKYALVWVSEPGLYQEQARGIWTYYHLKKAQYHEGPLFLKPHCGQTIEQTSYSKVSNERYVHYLSNDIP